MAYLQHIEQQQKAQNEDNNLVEIDLSLEAKVLLAYNHKTANRDKLLKKLARANSKKSKQRYKKTFVICKQAVELADTVLKKIFSGKRVLLNHKYISKITECSSTDQNKRILDQLDNLLGIEYHRLAVVDGTPYNYHYSFELQPTIIEELKDAGLWNLEFMPAKLRLSYNRPNTSIRSIRSRANFSNIKNSNSETSNIEPVETTQKAQAVETTSSKAATVTPIQTKPFRPSNKRKTKTQAEQKQRKASTVQASNVVQNGFLGGGKRLSEIQPFLTDELCERLRSKCGRSFTNQAIRQITKAIAASKKGSKAVFQHINGIVAYLTPALIKEKRDPNKIGGEGYYTLAGMTEEDKQLHKQESYLNQVENSGIHARCDYTQYRARIAGQFPTNLAYALLTSMTGVKSRDSVLEITMHRSVHLSQHYKQLLLKHATGVGGYAGVSELEFVGIASNSNIASKLSRNCESQTSEISQSTVVPDLVQREEFQLPEGKWGKVCSVFISQQEHGDSHYQNWLAGLEVTEDIEVGIIQLRTTSDMVRDRIEQTYLPFLSKVAGKFGIKEIILG